MNRKRLAFGCVVVLGLVGESANGQGLIRRDVGAVDRMLGNVVALGDQDHDGAFEYGESGWLLTWNPGTFHYDSTGVFLDVFSGASGALRFTIALDRAGWIRMRVADAGDVDGDGFPDVILSDSSFDDPNQPFRREGVVQVRSGQDGALIREWIGAADFEELGSACAGLDDVDRDGFADVLIQGETPGTGPFVRAMSGKSGAMLYEISDDVQLANRIGTGRDRDQDGIRDFLVRANENGTREGLVRSCSGASGSTIAELDIDAIYSRVYSAYDCDDLDGDGLPDLIGAFVENSCGPEGFNCPDGFVRIWSFATGDVLREHVFAGSGIANDSLLGDSDGDGTNDYLAFACDDGRAPSTHVFSGRTGNLLYRFEGELADGFGGVGDLDRDGAPDLLKVDPSFCDSNGEIVGAAYVISGNDFWLDADPRSANANDVETLTARGVPAGNLVGVVLVDVSGTSTFHVLAIAPADATEALVLSGSVPSGLAGLTATFQSFAIGRAGRVVDSARETIEFH